MLLAGFISVLVVALAAGLLAVSRYLLPQSVRDTRGIALQTVIIMVVLLVIAGGVAAVLLARGNEAVSDLQDTEVGRDLGEINNGVLCSEAGGSWTTAQSPATGGTCS